MIAVRLHARTDYDRSTATSALCVWISTSPSHTSSRVFPIS